MEQLCDKIVCKPPRELSGSSSSNRFDYQKDWTICKLLDLSSTERDFLILCDYHEDVTILDKEISPTKISFYQIKTDKRNNWTVNRLIRRKKGKKDNKLPSILGKLCQHCLDYSDFLDSLYFISNANFNMELKDGKNAIGRINISFVELSDVEKEKINKALITEFKEENIPIDKKLNFEVTDLSLNDHSSHTKGKLIEYFESINPNKTYPISAIYKTLFGEVKRRTNYEFSEDSYDNLIQKKGIGSSFVKKILGDVSNSMNPDDILNELMDRLRLEGVDLATSIKIQNHFRKYEVQRMDATNDYLHQDRSSIQKLCKEYLKTQSHMPLLDMAKRINDQMQLNSLFMGIEKVTAIMFWIIYEELSV